MKKRNAEEGEKDVEVGAVATTKGTPLKKSTIRRKKRAASPGRGKAWAFPRNTLEEAIRVAQAIDQQHAGKPVPADDLVKMVGLHQPDDWRFLRLLKSSQQYGLTDGTGKTATVRVTPLGQDIVAPSSPGQRQSALVSAFENVELFKQVREYYRGGRVPEDEYFANTLVRDFKVERDRVGTFIDVYTENLHFLKSFTGLAPRARDAESETGSAPVAVSGDKAVAPHNEEIREFLDTCFILMPFGGYFDVYYKEIYSVATKDAGFEPLRADSLFSTGSVMEQVWTQIKKAKVLLADLSDRNPNVFYELGLAHAARKPVVFVAKNIEDVPFDLRHLRVVLYETREPGWDDKLRQEIASYLKNTRQDPARSIPQPFRDERGDDGAGDREVERQEEDDDV